MPEIKTVKYNIGIDVGGTKIEAVLLSRGEVVHVVREKTASNDGYDVVLSQIEGLYQKVLSHINFREHTLGIGTPGFISSDDQKIRNSNLLCLNQKNLKKDIVEKIGRDFALDNDANCFALAEAILGGGRPHDMVFGAVLGTGCGGGIVYNKRIYRGSSSLAGEWGHLSLNPIGPNCYCGRRGCVETYISGGGLERRWMKERGKENSVIEIIAQCEAEITEGVEFINLFIHNFAQAMANLFTILDPDVVVLGGSVAKVDRLYSEGIGLVEKILDRKWDYPRIIKSSLGSKAGSIGATLLGMSPQSYR